MEYDPYLIAGAGYCADFSCNPPVNFFDSFSGFGPELNLPTYPTHEIVILAPIVLPSCTGKWGAP